MGLDGRLATAGDAVPRQIRFGRAFAKHWPFAAFMGCTEGGAVGAWLSVVLRGAVDWQLCVGGALLIGSAALVAAWAAAVVEARQDPDEAQRAYLEKFRRRCARAHDQAR